MRRIGPFQGSSIFDGLMRESIAKGRAASRARQAGVQAPVTSTGVTTERISDITSGTAGYASYATDGQTYQNQAGGMGAFAAGGARPTGSQESQFAAATEANYASIDGQVVDLSVNPELIAAENIERLSNPEAAAKYQVESVGLSQYGKKGKVALTAINALTSGPVAGILTSFMGGYKAVDPYGKTTTVPLGMLGVVSRKNIEKQYEVYDKIKSGTAGFHQFYSGGQLVSIVPQTLLGNQVGYAVLGTTNLTADQAIAQYSSMFGYDPSTVDMSKRPGDKGFGQELGGFIPGVGGIGVDNKFVDTLGTRTSAPRDTKAYFGMMADMYGTTYAAQQGEKMGLDANSLRDIAIGAVQPKSYFNNKGETVGYGTGTGGIVTDKDGNPVTSGGKPVSFGTGYMSTDSYDSIQESIQTAQTYGTNVGSQQTQMLAEQDRDFNDDNGGGAPGGYDAGGAETAGGWGSPFAQGGFVERKPMQEGGEAEVATEAGFVDRAPETVPDGETVADDVEMDVPEGTFVLNAAAVEFMGSADVKKMLLEAMEEAKKQGLDIAQENSKIPREELVSLVVSKGEVIVPPQLAQIIGYDRLNKINNRGKAEVQKRIEENGQAEQPQDAPGVIKASVGGYIDPKLDELLYSRAILEAVEGLSTQDPHVPSDTSGLTVGSGLDLGQHSEFDLRERYKMPDEFIELARPFLAPGQGQKGPLGAKAKSLYDQVGPRFNQYSDAVSQSMLNSKFSEFQEKYPQYRDVNPKDKASLFSMYYVGALDRYSTLQKVYQKTGDMPRAIDEGLLRVIKDKKSPEYNRAVNLLTFYYTADDADVLQDRNAGQLQSYAMDMLKTQREDRNRIEKQKREGSFLD